MEDSAIVTLYWQRSEQAIAESDTKYGPYCGHIAYGLLQNSEDTQECVSDTWLAAWNAMPPHRPAVLRLFLAKITRNLAFSRWRNLTAQKRGGGELPLVLEELEECVGTGEEVGAALEAKELTRSIGKLLDTLSPLEQNIFLRRYFFLEDAGAIAARYGLRRDSVNQSLCRTRKKLKAHLIQEGYAV